MRKSLKILMRVGLLAAVAAAASACVVDPGYGYGPGYYGPGYYGPSVVVESGPGYYHHGGGYYHGGGYGYHHWH